MKIWTIGENQYFFLIWKLNILAIGTLPQLKDNSQKIDFCLGVDCEPSQPIEEDVDEL